MGILDLLKKFTAGEKLVIAVIVAVLLVFVFSGDKTVAEPVDLEALAQPPQYGVQDLRFWSQGAVGLSDDPNDMSGYTIYKYRIDRDLLEEYIALLQQNGFTLVDEHHQSSYIGSFQSYGLICDAATDVPTMEQMYTDTPCHINIWKSDTKWRIEVCDGLQLRDLGLRRDGSKGIIEPQGESLGAGLKRTSSEKYKTTDGRLAAKVGQANVITDGKKTTREAVWKSVGNKKYITVKVSEALTVEIRYLSYEVESGSIFLLEEMGLDTATVTLTRGEDDITAGHTGVVRFHSASIRIMYLEEEGDVVVYLCAQPMDTENYPEEIEILCAVNTAPAEEQGSGSGSGSGGSWWDDDEPFVPEYAKQDCLTCRGSGNCTTCGGDGYTDIGGYKGGCRSCHGDGDCNSCNGSGKRD